VRASGPTDRKVDAEKAARRRVALRETILGKTCLSAIEILFDYSKDPNCIKTADLCEAAEIVLDAVQRELRQRRSIAPLVPEIAYELANARHWALHALRDRLGVKRAKQVDLRITDGVLLTICTGATLPPRSSLETAYSSSRAPFLAGVVIKFKVSDRAGRERMIQVPVSGCLRIFEDCNRTSARPWAYWCRDCSRCRTRLEERVESQYRRLFSNL
jgi:hypothetical protein